MEKKLEFSKKVINNIQREANFFFIQKKRAARQLSIFYNEIQSCKRFYRRFPHDYSEKNINNPKPGKHLRLKVGTLPYPVRNLSDW